MYEWHTRCFVSQNDNRMFCTSDNRRQTNPKRIIKKTKCGWSSIFFLSNYDLVSLFSDRSFIQFLHRNVAYFIVLFVIAIGIKMYIEKKFIYFKNYLLVFSVLIIQVLLGIYTLVSGLNLYLASLHQITSVILVFTVLKLNHNLS